VPVLSEISNAKQVIADRARRAAHWLEPPMAMICPRVGHKGRSWFRIALLPRTEVDLDVGAASAFHAQERNGPLTSYVIPPADEPEVPRWEEK
jgi:hypothetical protein